jgi:hypothetical protein
VEGAEEPGLCRGRLLIARTKRSEVAKTFPLGCIQTELLEQRPVTQCTDIRTGTAAATDFVAVDSADHPGAPASNLRRSRSRRAIPPFG